VPVEGLGTPAGTVLVGKKDVDRSRAPHPQDAGRHDAAGGHPRARPGSTRSSTTSIASPRTTRTRSASPKGLARSGCTVDPVQTNMVFATVPKEQAAR
jgi:hypothetical protein